MADKRPRSHRPRRRGGQGRLANRAVVQRQNQHISALQAALEPEVEALAGSATRQEVVDRIRTQATRLARQRVEGDVSTVVEATLDEIFGLGPLEPVLRDPDNHTIRIDDAEVQANGQPVERGFRDAAHARSMLDRILAAVGLELDASPEGVFATMIDGSTVRARLDGGVLRVDIRRPG